jgi:N-acetylglutamate synthase-like GNAT family acetyltransferase
LRQLQILLDHSSFWAAGRSLKDLREILRQSAACVSAWKDGELVGFGRASSDGLFRAVLWDVVVCGDAQGLGLGRQIVEALLSHSRLRHVERVYLMTSNCAGFYERLGFEQVTKQQLLLKTRTNESG